MILQALASARRLARTALTLGLLALVVVAPASASASPNTVKRGFGNMLGGPLDVFTSPAVALLAVLRNMRQIDDPAMVRVIFFVPGVVWITGVNCGAGSIRTIIGGFEFVPGVFLFPFETDLDPLMPPTERAPALVIYDNPLFWSENPLIRYNPLLVPVSPQLRFGLNYTSSD